MKPFDISGARQGTSRLVIAGLTLLLAAPVWAQNENPTPQPEGPVPAMVGINNGAASKQNYNPDASGDRMLTPPPVSGQMYPIALGSQERSNYLSAGLSFMTSYMDNALAGLTAKPISDISYSVAPMIALDETTTRMYCTLSYAPGYTFYQRTSELNAQDHNASIQFQYRLSPHVTLSAMDGFQKTSNIFNQPPDLGSPGVVSGGVQQPNFSVFTPIANELSNSGSVGLSYQYALNDMIGATGTFTNLHYLDQAQVPGLFDASSQGGLGFYSHRVGKGQYIGATYAYQRLLSYPVAVAADTQTHAALFFYTFAPTSSRFSISMFGGPQYSDTAQSAIPTLRVPASDTKMWTPGAGASLGWQDRLNSLALSYTHIVSSGGGLIDASKMDSAMLSGRQQLTKTLSASLTGGYTQNDMIGNPLFGAYNGHTITGTASLQQQFGQHLSAQIGYTRLYQSYGNIAAISANPNMNREFVAISYQFSRPLGR
jgi:hypothetical protein